MNKILRVSLVWQIAIGMIIGLLWGIFSPATANSISLLGDLFVKALKAIAPVLIFVLIAVALATKERGTKTGMRPIIAMYFAGMLTAAAVAAILSFIFPVTLILPAEFSSAENVPMALGTVLKNIIMSAVDNPLHAVANANFIGVVAWGVGAGLALHHHCSSPTKQLLRNVNDATLKLTQIVIRFAPLGVMGIVAGTVAQVGIGAFAAYAHLVALLVGAMLITLFVVNPLIMFVKSRRNPFPVIFLCLRESALTAFFTRSSAANTPINLALCKKMGLNEDTYSIAIPLGSVINMSGAAITISVFALAAANTLGIHVSFGGALVLCIISALGACGTSGIAGGSLLLIPLACSLFQISSEVAMQVVAIGFVVGVVQDSCETALNSSTDVMFAAAASKKAPILNFTEKESVAAVDDVDVKKEPVDANFNAKKSDAPN